MSFLGNLAKSWDEKSNQLTLSFPQLFNKIVIEYPVLNIVISARGNNSEKDKQIPALMELLVENTDIRHINKWVNKIMQVWEKC